MISLSSDQQNVLDKILYWFKNDKDKKQFITLGGYAGTGKTTLIAFLRQEINKIDKNLKVGFVSYTGKAARVLKTKLKEQKVVLPGDSVSTIHALIYSPVVNEKEEIIGWQTKDEIECNLIIVDEASMVDGEIWHHLLSYKVPMNFTKKRSQIMAGDLFDFGYALTVHKAQGSQAKRVILFEERFKQMTDEDWKRWLYTAVTRAEEELYIFPR